MSMTSTLDGAEAQLSRWIFPVDTAVVRDAAQKHRGVAHTRAIAALPGCGPLAGVAAALRQSFEFMPDVLEQAPGCAGVHLGEQALLRPYVLDEFKLFVAETVALVGGEFSTDGGPAASVYFPSRGTLASRIDGSAQCFNVTARSGEIAIKWSGQSVSARVSHDAHRPRDIHASAGVIVENSPRIDFVRVESRSALMSAALPSSVRAQPEDYCGSLDATLQLARSVAPHLFEQLRILLTCVIPLERPCKQSGVSGSDAHRLPGVLYASLSDALENLVLLCHEFCHLQLSMLQESVPLLEHPSRTLRVPWRSDTSTAESVLHSAYVFLGAADLVDRASAKGHSLVEGTRRIAWWRICTREAIMRLRGSNALSAQGLAFVQLMNEANNLALSAAGSIHPYVRWAERLLDGEGYFHAQGF
jgi:HEXXH motif-containing protein